VIRSLERTLRLSMAHEPAMGDLNYEAYRQRTLLISFVGLLQRYWRSFQNPIDTAAYSSDVKT
jgi:hypothetical protein